MKTEIKVMISYPPLRGEKGVAMLSQNRQFQWFSVPSCLYPIVAASAATMLARRGYKTIWKDAIAEGIAESDYYTQIGIIKPDVIALETKTPVIKLIWNVIDRIKKASPKTKVALVGDHVTAMPLESMKKSKADFILTGGDYDFLLVNLCNHLFLKEKLEKGVWYRKNGKVQNTGKFELNHNLDDVPLIDRGLTKEHLYMSERNIKFSPYAYTMAGRDCPYHRCRFCSWTTLYPKFRARTVENYLDEIGYLIGKYHVREVFDDTGTFPTGTWLKKFCESMIKRGYNKTVCISCNMRVDYITPENARLMKRAGFRLLKVGLESANQKTLDRLNKGITVQKIYDGCKYAKQAGLEVHLTVMVGYPWENKEDAARTYAFTKKLIDDGCADVFQSTIVVPYPGTPLFKEARKEKWFRIDPLDYDFYDMKKPVLKTGDMSAEEVANLCSKMYRIYFSPKYVARRLVHLRPGELRYLLRGLVAVIAHVKDFRKKECNC